MKSTEEKAQVLLRDMMKECEDLKDQAKALEVDFFAVRN